MSSERTVTAAFATVSSSRVCHSSIQYGIADGLRRGKLSECKNDEQITQAGNKTT